MKIFIILFSLVSMIIAFCLGCDYVSITNSNNNLREIVEHAINKYNVFHPSWCIGTQRNVKAMKLSENCYLISLERMLADGYPAIEEVNLGSDQILFLLIDQALQSGRIISPMPYVSSEDLKNNRIDDYLAVDQIGKINMSKKDVNDFINDKNIKRFHINLSEVNRSYIHNDIWKNAVLSFEHGLHDMIDNAIDKGERDLWLPSPRDLGAFIYCADVDSQFIVFDAFVSRLSVDKSLGEYYHLYVEQDVDDYSKVVAVRYFKSNYCGNESLQQKYGTNLVWQVRVKEGAYYLERINFEIDGQKQSLSRTK